MKRVYRSRHTKVLGGVAAGLAEYFDIDVTVMRLIFALLLVTIPNTIIAYILAWIIIPEEPAGLSSGVHEQSSTGGAGMTEKQENMVSGGMTADEILGGQGAGTSGAAASSSSGAQTSEAHTGQKPVHGSGDKSRQLLGYILIAIGALVMMNRYLPFSVWSLSRQLAKAWPLAIIAIGIAIIVGAVRGR